MARIARGGDGASRRRADLRQEAWPGHFAWGATEERGFFSVPRSLPLVLRALGDKKVTGTKDVGSVYLELFSRHWDGGVVEMTHESEHAFAAGYASTKTWRERMRVLEELGFIKVRASGVRDFAHVLLIHPSVAMQGLRDQGLVPDELWNAYRDVQRMAKERTPTDLASPPAPWAAP